MSGLVQILRRLGSPDAVSWPVFWVSLAMNAFLVFAGSLDTGLTLGEQLVLLFCAQAAVMGFLWLCRLTVLRYAARRPRPVVTLMCFVGAGLARGVTAAVLHTAFLGPDTTRLGTRLLAGVVAVVGFLVPTSIIVASWRDYRDRRAQLFIRQAQLADTANRLVADIAERDRSVVDRIRSELDRVLAGADPRARLQQWSQEVIRPLSHQLASEVDDAAPRAVVSERVRAAAVVDRATCGRPLMPITTAIAVNVIAFLAIWVAYGVWLTLVYVAVVFTSGAVLLWLANRLVAVVSGFRVIVRALVMMISLVMVGLAVGELAHLVLPERELTYSIIRGNAILFLAFGVGLALARAVSHELRRTLVDLEAADAQLTWQVARLRLVQWAQGARFARALHGPVQGSIALAVERLRAAPDDQVEVLSQLRTSLMDSLDGDAAAPSWPEGLERLSSSWKGVCRVTVDDAEGCGERLDADADCREMALEIVSEAVSNAVRHGKASQVWIAVSCGVDRVDITVWDDGAGGVAESSGLGTRVLESCALAWSREPAAGASTLQATLPLGPDLGAPSRDQSASSRAWTP